MSWGPDGIVFGEQAGAGIMRVSPDGGTPEPVVHVNEGETAYGPQLLPGGTHVLFTLATGSTLDRWDKANIVVQSLASRSAKVIVEGGSDGRYLPTGISCTRSAGPFRGRLRCRAGWRRRRRRAGRRRRQARSSGARQAPRTSAFPDTDP